MSRFSAKLNEMHETVLKIQSLLTSKPYMDVSRSEIAVELQTISDSVHQLRDMLDISVSGKTILAWLHVENRLRRCKRLLDLGAPVIILQNELRWLDTAVHHMEQHSNGIKPIFTNEEIEDLESEASANEYDDDDDLDRVRGALMGLAIGDAMGATTEFLSPSEIRDQYGYITDILGGGWLNLLPGDTTDDTAMTVCVAEGIIASPDEPIDAIGSAFLRWNTSNPPDIGITIRETFNHFAGDWNNASYETHLKLKGKSAGNGSLMRCIPVALAYPDQSRMDDITERQSKMTHFDDLASEACLIYNRIAMRVLNHDNLLRAAIVVETENTRYHGVYLSRPECNPDGFVVNTFTWVLYLVWNYRSFEEVIQHATNEGYDSDTVAAIAGGLKGLESGLDGIPKNLRQQINNGHQLDELAKALYQVRLSRKKSH